MKKTIISVASALALTAVSFSAVAVERPNISIGPTAGTTGLGGDISLRFNDHWGMSLGHQTFSHDTTYEDTDLTYDAELNLNTTSLVAEYFPTGNSFFISAGLAKPDNYLDVTAVPSGGEYTVNGNTYDASDVDSISGHAGLGDSLSPYIGIGFKSNKNKGFGYFSEIGVYKLDPSTSLNANYLASADPAFRDQLDEDLRNEENELKDSIDKFGVYPVAKIGIFYTF